MIHLRSWMERNGISRQEIADQFGITRGHLSTLINANRTASQDQVNKALALVEAADDLRALWGRDVDADLVAPKRLRKEPKKKAEGEPKKVRRPNNLRPMTTFETQFVTDVARAWINANTGASPDEFVKIVRALSIGIRS